MRTVIGITGQKQSGKDTLAKEIKRKRSNYLQYAFAQPLKEAAKMMFGWTDEELEFNKESTDSFWGISPRQVLQYLGTEVGRKGFPSTFKHFNDVTGENIWINRFQRFLSNTETPILLDSNAPNVVVSDIRFLNELNAVKNLNEYDDYFAVVVGIHRTGYNGDNHASETEIPKCIEQADYVFQNDYGLDEVRSFVTELLEIIDYAKKKKKGVTE